MPGNRFESLPLLIGALAFTHARMSGLEEYREAYITVCVFAFLIGATVGFTSGPLGSSILVDLAILLYAVLLTIAPSIRWVGISLAAGTHVAALLSYYSNPLPLPFIILERGLHGYTLNVDLVQAVIFYELVFEHKIFGSKEKTLKSPVGNAPGDGTPKEPP